MNAARHLARTTSGTARSQTAAFSWAGTICLLVAAAACGGGGSGSLGGGGGGGGNPTECADGRPAYETTFEGIQDAIFARHGCNQDLCHGSGAAGGLDLREDSAYASLFDVKSLGSSLVRVEPGDEERSYLWLKLAAATRPDGGYVIAGAPMPNGQAPLSENELELVRLWIYAGAPKDGVVRGSEALLDACLPPPKPIEIEPLEPPAAGTGFQVKMPDWDLLAATEFEGCMATYYDVSAQVPAEFRDAGNTMFTFDSSEVRQDPQSHHVFLYYPFGNFSPGGVDVYAPEFGAWTCRGGAEPGKACDPKDLTGCGEGVCTSELVESFGCIGFGPRSAGLTTLIGGAGQAVSFTEYPQGVFGSLPMKGVIYWNSHAFNLSSIDGVMHGAINYYFAEDRRLAVQGLSDFSAIFMPNAAPYTTETYCNDHVVARGAHVFQLQTHTHQRGKHTWVTMPDGSMIYENFSFSDPVTGRYNPPLVFDSPDPAQRTLTYCGTYNNGVAADGSPDPAAVTKLSRLRQTVGAGQPGGSCNPVACTKGKIGSACNGENDDATCDSTPGAGDGDCDACPIVGGESTENEMFNFFGLYYLND